MTTKWITKMQRNCATPTIRFELHAGAKGKGRLLGAVNSWDNPRALDEADRLCAELEKRYGDCGRRRTKAESFR